MVESADRDRRRGPHRRVLHAQVGDVASAQAIFQRRIGTAPLLAPGAGAGAGGVDFLAERADETG